MKRRQFLKIIGFGGMVTSGHLGKTLFAKTNRSQPNVLFIAVDDLNDWVGCFGGHPQAITPNMDKLARNGGVVFHRAYCPASVCCPSRSALLTGVLPSESGVYGNGQNLKNAERTKNAITLPQYFSQNGYVTLSMGKIFHKHATKNGIDEGQWAYDEWQPSKSRDSRNPDTSKGPANNLPFLPDSRSGGSPFD
jgi:arylsulfatase A-like enzyme